MNDQTLSNPLSLVLSCGIQFHKLINREMAGTVETYHLRTIDIVVLYHLNQEEQKGVCEGRPFEKMVRNKMCTRGHISQSLSRLLKEGYITVERDEKDRRRTHNHLTEKARPIIASIQDAEQNALRLALDGFTDQEISEFSRFLKKSEENLSRALRD